MNISGISVAGVETCVEVPAFGLLFDLGRCTRTAVNAPLVLLSHGHLDHIGAVAQHAARRAMMKMGETTYVVPEAIRPDVERLLDAAGVLDGSPIPRRVVGLGHGEELALGKGRWVRPFETFHRVPSQGYTIWERRHRLRREFHDLPGERIAELRKQGVAVHEDHDVPLVSFSGDTRIEVLERNPELAETEVLVLETTFLDARVKVSDAREMGHIHLDEVLARADLLTKGRVVLHHFSARYADADIERILTERLLDTLRGRITTLATPSSLAPAR